MPHDEITKARQILARNYGAEFEVDNKAREARQSVFHLPRIETHSTRTQAPEETEQQMTQRTWQAWEDWLDAHLKNLADMIGQEIGETDKAVNARLSAIEQAIGEMKAERTVERAAAGIVDAAELEKAK
jgi:hypothetical protein